MPTISSEVTFAFSEREDAWTTRYSFVPSCYANCSDEMISFRDGVAKGWLHDKNPKRNFFYGGGIDEHSLSDGSSLSSIELVFNDSPSDIKIFNSMSLESNVKAVQLFYETNSEQSGSDFQQGDSLEVGKYSGDGGPDFISAYSEASVQEGFLNFNLPRDQKNSTSNISILPGILNLEETIEDAKENFDGPNESNNGLSIEFDLSSYSVAFEVGSNQQESQLVSSVSGSALQPFNVFATSIEGIAFENFGFYCYAKEVNGGVVTLVFPLPDGIDDEATKNIYFSAVQQFLGAEGGVFVVTPQRINGDQFRGPYFKTIISFVESQNPIEFHAANANYQFSSSATRLTQNS